MVALGYRDAGDFNATLPKSRLPEEEIFTLL
jgi:nitroreductase/dihydropteridine reductase